MHCQLSVALIDPVQRDRVTEVRVHYLPHRYNICSCTEAQDFGLLEKIHYFDSAHDLLNVLNV